jgi:hypothetical protein
MRSVTERISGVYRVKSYIIVATFLSLAAALLFAFSGYFFGDFLQRSGHKKPPSVPLYRTALVILNYYLPILAAIGAGIFQGKGGRAVALSAPEPERRIANIYTALLFSFVLGAPIVAYALAEPSKINDWFVGCSALLASLLVTVVGYYFGVAERIDQARGSSSEDRVSTAGPGAEGQLSRGSDAGDEEATGDGAPVEEEEEEEGEEEERYAGDDEESEPAAGAQRAAAGRRQRRRSDRNGQPGGASTNTGAGQRRRTRKPAERGGAEAQQVPADRAEDHEPRRRAPAGQGVKRRTQAAKARSSQAGG